MNDVRIARNWESIPPVVYDGDEAISTRVLEKEYRDMKARNAELEAQVEEMATNPCGEYYAGLRCGVEDIDAGDIYEAAEYGWEQAFEYVASCIPTPPEPKE